MALVKGLVAPATLVKTPATAGPACKENAAFVHVKTTDPPAAWIFSGIGGKRVAANTVPNPASVANAFLYLLSVQAREIDGQYFDAQ